MSAHRLVSRVPFLAALAANDQDRLLARATVRRLRRGQDLWRHGDAADEFLFVLHGRVKLVHVVADGRAGIVDLRGAGQLTCSGASCIAAPYCCDAVAHEDDVDVVALPRQEVLALLERCPAAARAFLQETASCTVALCQRIEELTSGAVDRRLAMLLLRLADQLGQPREHGAVWVPVALSRQDLADLCNTAVESAIRGMRRLSKDGIVDTRPRGFLVHNRDALAALAE